MGLTDESHHMQTLDRGMDSNQVLRNVGMRMTSSCNVALSWGGRNKVRISACPFQQAFRA